MDRLAALEKWLAQYYGDNHFTLQALSGDASFRRYFRVRQGGCKTLAVDMPPDKEDLEGFVRVTQQITAVHLLVPHIHSMDLKNGFLLIDDFGDDLLSTQLNEDTAEELYSLAIDNMLVLQTIDASAMPHYDTTMLLDEMRIFTDWYCIVHKGVNPNDKRLQQLESGYRYIASVAVTQPQVFTHRDYHSRNLIYTADKQIAIIDYQDAVRGPIAYDLVSLLKDCYIKWHRDKQLHWLEYYLARSDINMSLEQLVRWFDLTGVQRHLKAAGIFARLHHRDGKDNYLKDIPRTLSYITDLKGDDPALSDLQSALVDLNLL